MTVHLWRRASPLTSKLYWAGPAASIKDIKSTVGRNSNCFKKQARKLQEAQAEKLTSLHANKSTS